MKNFLKQFWNDESGQTLTEYALILAVIAVAVIGLMVTMGDKIKEVFQSIIDALTGSESTGDTASS